MVGVCSVGVVEDKGSVSMDGLRNAITRTPGRGIGVVAPLVATTTRG